MIYPFLGKMTPATGSYVLDWLLVAPLDPPRTALQGQILASKQDQASSIQMSFATVEPKNRLASVRAPRENAPATEGYTYSRF